MRASSRIRQPTQQLNTSTKDAPVAEHLYAILPVDTQVFVHSTPTHKWLMLKMCWRPMSDTLSHDGYSGHLDTMHTIITLQSKLHLVTRWSDSAADNLWVTYKSVSSTYSPVTLSHLSFSRPSRMTDWYLSITTVQCRPPADYLWRHHIPTTLIVCTVHGKRCHYIFASNFSKCRPICTVRLPTDFAVNFQ